MRDAEPEKTDELFASLIDAETDAALARFRSGNFEANVWKHVKDAARSSPKSPFAPILARPVWGGIAAGILVIAVGFALFHRPVPRVDLARSIEDGLRLAPGIEALEAELSAPDRKPVAEPDAPDAIRLAAVIAGNRDAGGARSTGRGEEISLKKRGLRPLSLEEIYKIVSIDKSIERVLTFVTS